MDLITLEELETAFGVTPIDDEEEALWSRTISAVSDFINEYCTDSFELVDNDTIRRQADPRGEVFLPGGPIHKVISVEDFRWGSVLGDDFYIDWDGLDHLFNAAPGQVLDITYKHGWDGPPRDVQNVVIQACDQLINGPSDLTIKQVGDVMETYDARSFVSNFLSDHAQRVLAKYGGGGNYFTIETGGSSYPSYNFQGYLTDDEV